MVGGVEHAVLQHVVQLEVGLELVLVEGVLARRAPCRCSTPSPRLQRDLEAAAAPRRSSSGSSAASLLRVGHRRRRQLGQQLVDGFRRLRGLVFQRRRRRSSGSRAASAFSARSFSTCEHDRGVVELAAAAAARERRLVSRRSRTARFVSCACGGWPVVLSRAITYLPSRPRFLAAAAAASICVVGQAGQFVAACRPPRPSRSLPSARSG